MPPEVGKVGTNSPTYIQPVSQRSDGIKSFFQKQAASPAKSKIQTNAIPKSEQGKAAPTPVTAKREREDEKKPNLEVEETPTKGHKRRRTESPSSHATPSANRTKSDPEIKEEQTLETSKKDGKAELVSKVEEGDVEVGLGDDSNAPQPDISKESGSRANAKQGRKVKNGAADEEGSADSARANAKEEEEEEAEIKVIAATQSPVPESVGKRGKRGGHETKVTRKAENEGDKSVSDTQSSIGFRSR